MFPIAQSTSSPRKTSTRASSMDGADYRVLRRNISEYEFLKTAIAQRPREVDQQLTLKHDAHESVHHVD